jgi:hypothetical protein
MNSNVTAIDNSAGSLDISGITVRTNNFLCFPS